MCPVPKAVQENPDKEAIAIPVATVDLAAELNSSEDTAGLIHNSHNNQSTEQIVQKLVITVSISTSQRLEPTKLEKDSFCSESKINHQLVYPLSCELHAPKQISCISVENCSNLTYHEETKVHHLSSIATDWTLLIDRLAANCRNTSDEVYPRIYVGDRGAAKNAFFLKKIGVTHVLNTAEGKRTGMVDTNEDFYWRYGMTYMGLKLKDVAQTNISKHFSEVSDYIDEALNEGGKVFVNCLKGMSRSSTVVLAYLMQRKNMTAIDALTIVRRHRAVCPNDGFLKQLAELDNKLRRERGQLQSRTSTTPIQPKVQ